MALSRALITHLPIPPALRRRLLRQLDARKYQANLAALSPASRAAWVKERRVEQDESDRMNDEEGAVRDSNELVRKAGNLHVPIPQVWGSDGEITEFWDRSHFTGELYLTGEGFVKVREAIRQELKWKDQRRSHLIVWVSAITGLIGALTGLLAVLFLRE